MTAGARAGDVVMTTKILTGIYGAVYNLTAPITTLTIAATGYLGAGVTSAGPNAYTIVNAGGIRGKYFGISLAGGGVITNASTIVATSTTSSAGIDIVAGGAVTNEIGATISGGDGVDALDLVTIINRGSISGRVNYGIELASGGLVVNGDAADTAAFIRGPTGILGGDETITLNNYGTILGFGHTGSGGYFGGGGVVTNGSAGDAAAVIQGYAEGVGFAVIAGTMINFGLVRGVGTASVGVVLGDGGLVVNGSATDVTATILGAAVSVEVLTAAGTVNNFGTLGGVGANVGAALEGGGLIVNGSVADTAALIEGGIGVAGETILATVNNFGTIKGGVAGESQVYQFQDGVLLFKGGRVINGSSTDTVAMLQGVIGVVGLTTAMTVTNFGTITGSYGGVYFTGGGRVTNGSATDTGARISGPHGVAANTAAVTVTNFGTIQGAVAAYGGIILAAGGVVTNGGGADHAALIQGFVGVTGGAGLKVTNNATISGELASGGYGVFLGASSSLVNNAGALVTGYGGVFADATSTVTNFGTIEGVTGYAARLGDPTARLNAEAGSLFKGAIEADAGLVDVVGGVVTASAIITAGKIIGAGTLSLNGGSSFFDTGAVLRVAKIAVSGASTQARIESKLVDSKVWTQTAGHLFVDSADQITFTGTGNSFSGTINGAGAVLFSGGSDRLSNVTISTAKTTISKSAVTLSGTIDLTGAMSATTTSLIVAAGGATLTGGGKISLSNLATNSLRGASSTAVLTNGDIIRGAGQLGGGVMTLVNAASGIIEGVGSAGLVIDTGANTITNAGTIEALTGDVTTIAGAVANTGLLASVGGTLVVNGAVTGTGSVKVNGGAVDFSGTFNEAVVFGSSGRLILAHSTTYTASLTSFSHTGTTSLDLRDISFASATSSFSGTTAAGILTVTDGTHTAHIHLTGNYTAAAWTLSDDGSGGTIVVDPTAPKPASQAHALVAAAASLGASSASTTASFLAAPPPAWQTAIAHRS
jgi:hypothetical protein